MVCQVELVTGPPRSNLSHGKQGESDVHMEKSSKQGPCIEVHILLGEISFGSHQVMDVPKKGNCQIGHKSVCTASQYYKPLHERTYEAEESHSERLITHIFYYTGAAPD